jgi:putative PIN family toxin of toxin-antitoxin system
LKVFLDTNVLVSAFATRGLSADVLRVVMAEHELVTSEVVLDELQRVLAEKIGAPATAIDAAVGLLRKHHVEPRPADPYLLDIDDACDEWVVASVVSCDADVFVTGDRQLLDGVGEVEGIRFLSPREFWELLSQ